MSDSKTLNDMQVGAIAREKYVTLKNQEKLDINETLVNSTTNLEKTKK